MNGRADTIPARTTKSGVNPHLRGLACSRRVLDDSILWRSELFFLIQNNARGPSIWRIFSIGPGRRERSRPFLPRPAARRSRTGKHLKGASSPRQNDNSLLGEGCGRSGYRGLRDSEGKSEGRDRGRQIVVRPNRPRVSQLRPSRKPITTPTAIADRRATIGWSDAKVLTSSMACP